MPKVSLGPLGVNASNPSEKRNDTLPPRTQIKGWTPGAARRNSRFLMTVDPTGLTGTGLAVTLTTRDIPASPADWSRRIAALLEWFRRRGLLRYHWVTEWQARGAPHLHLMAYFDTDELVASLDRDEGDGDDSLQRTLFRRREQGGEELAEAVAARFFTGTLVQHWTGRIAADLGATFPGQHVKQVSCVAGWCEYLAKHASRGVIHYQRQGGQLPPGWETSGRLWARGGDWPTRTDDLEVDHRTLDRFKRLLARHQRGQALATLGEGRRWGNQVQTRSAKGQLRHLARRGSGKAMDEDVRLALALANRAQAKGDRAAHARHVEQLRQLRAKAGEGHRRTAAVRGLSRHISERQARAFLDAALDHPEGYEAAWVPHAVRIAEARRQAREEREAQERA